MDELSEMAVAERTAAPPPVHYVGFWARVFASLVDSIVVLFILVPVGLLLKLAGIGIAEGDPYAQTLVELMSAAIIVLFWVAKMATPGKIIIDAVIVDAQTFEKPGWQQYVGRYLAYFVSIIPLCLGLLWVGFDRRKQGWHDKLAGTVVVRRPASLPQTTI
ncbi:RDD family protein [Solimonas terrae]|uniref:RDD family protein n=1 Tax=Solimonas terrae TaxID=1396819 RepID=A0A6M2BW18_9GAMM|nr:RDD family protein [Solimonas terrae]NGY06584.1 RDD family protein [Solimonas terrae]